MLLEFGVKNFFAFREEAALSLRFDANCPSAVSNGRDFSTALCIKGANSCGKTQILKALSFLKYFCYDSFSARPDEAIAVLPFFSSPEPCEFFIEFEQDGIEYRYELCTTSREVVRETLYKTRAKKVKLLERLGNAISYRTQTLHMLDAVKLRKNVSVIATARQYELDGLQPIYAFFSSFLSNVGFGGLREMALDINEVAHFLAETEPVLAFVTDFIRQCDTGVSDIQIAHVPDQNGNKVFFPLFLHDTDHGTEAIGHMMESSGTRTLFNNLGAYKLTLERGGVLIMDEFDLNLHPHILPKLVKLFLDPETNPRGAQFVFSSHDSEIMNLLGRYRVVLVEKQDNESFAYRLDEIPGDILRNDRPIRPVYNDGKIGGVPRL